MHRREFALQKPAVAPYDVAHFPATRRAERTAPMDDARFDSTLDLVERAKTGDADALNRLFTRFLPALRRWASGRLPRYTRDLMDTDDLVQETVIRAVHRIGQFESRHEGALQAYLRQAVMTRIRDEVRRTGRNPAAAELDDQQRDRAASPLELAIGHE